MCVKNNQPVGEYNSPCGSCPEYLNSCMPVVANGFLIECDLCYLHFLFTGELSAHFIGILVLVMW